MNDFRTSASADTGSAKTISKIIATLIGQYLWSIFPIWISLEPLQA